MLMSPSPKVIWLRCGNQPSAKIAELLRKHLDAIEEFEVDVERTCLEISS